MNAISITMAKGTMSQPLYGAAFRLTALMVVFSWTACQLLVAGGAYHKVGDPLRAMATLGGGVVLLLCSLVLLLALKRRELSPTRESALLFFWAFLLALPGATWWVFESIARILSVLTRRPHTGGTEIALLYASVVISVAYAIVILVWLKTNVAAYDHAPAGALSARIIRRLEVLLVEPYFK